MRACSVASTCAWKQCSGRSAPRANPYNTVGLAVGTGEIQGVGYQNYSVQTAWRPTRFLQLTLSEQIVRHGDRQEQTILSANWDLGREFAMSGRAVRQAGATNFYLALRRAGNRGAEYYLILGDPNATKFQRSLILKVVVPFSIHI